MADIGSKLNKRFQCERCNFHSLDLRRLLNHLNLIHSQELNFKVKCCVSDCNAFFTKYNSLYKHVVKQHKHLYDDDGTHNDINKQLTPAPLIIDDQQQCQGIISFDDVDMENVETHEESLDEYSDNNDLTQPDDVPPLSPISLAEEACEVIS